MEIGLYTFADVAPHAPAQQRLKNLIEEIELADEVGLDVFGVGEHHRPDYSVSAPAVVLAAAASRTRRIRLTSAVTVLGSDDPIRVFQQFSTLDLISGGRAEIMAGRGSFIESFPLFGYDLADYDRLFAEKLDRLLKLRESPGAVYPHPIQKPLPVWIAVGGTPQSVVRAATLGLPLALAIIGGEPTRFAPFFDLYRDSARRAGHDPASLQTGLNMHGFVAETTDQAKDVFYPPHAEVMTRIGRERGWPPQSRAQFEASAGPSGHLLIGNPEQVAEKIVRLRKIFANTRILVQMAIGTMPHPHVLKAIELMGTKVAPLVRKELS